MLADAVASVDDWHGRELGSQLRAADVRMSDHDGVGIAAQRADRVRETLALQDRRPLRIDADDLASATFHGRIEGRAGARRGLVKHRGKDLALENVEYAVPLDLQLHLVREREEVMHITMAELLDGQDMAAVEGWMRAMVDERGWRRALQGSYCRRRIGELCSSICSFWRTSDVRP